MPMRICTSAEMKELDRVAEEEYGISAQILMENAGRAAVQVLFDTYPDAGKNTEILVFAGKGNNAGDAFVFARRLLCLERRVRVFMLLGPDQLKGAAKQNYEILARMKAKIVQVETASNLEAFFDSSSGPFTVIDGMLGTGLKGNLGGIYYDCVNLLNNQNIDQVVALDIPTGVNGDTGVVHGTALNASLTVSFGFPKLGHFFPPGASKRGKLVNVDISLPPEFRKQGETFLLRKAPMKKRLISRDLYGHKNAFGHTLLIGGSRGRLGAICMAANACHKMGTGLVTVATWPEGFETLLVKLPQETMAVSLKTESPDILEEYRKMIPIYSSVVIGPGLGKRQQGKKLMEGALSIYGGPMVIDADGLNLISEHGLHDLVLKRNAPTVLTPHIGEMARLLDMDKDKVLENPIDAVKRAVEKTHSVIVLKGAATVIGSTENVVYLNHYPNDGMATAGSGDVLAGMIGGLIGQKFETFEASQIGVFLHSLAGDKAAHSKGARSMTSSDIIDSISTAFEDIREMDDAHFPEAGRADLL